MWASDCLRVRVHIKEALPIQWFELVLCIRTVVFLDAAVLDVELKAGQKRELLAPCLVCLLCLERVRFDVALSIIESTVCIRYSIATLHL